MRCGAWVGITAFTAFDALREATETARSTRRTRTTPSQASVYCRRDRLGAKLTGH